MKTKNQKILIIIVSSLLLIVGFTFGRAFVSNWNCFKNGLGI